MSNSGHGGCISLVLWFIISAIIAAITDSVFVGMIGGGIAILAIAYLLTKD